MARAPCGLADFREYKYDVKENMAKKITLKLNGLIYE